MVRLLCKRSTSSISYTLISNGSAKPLCVGRRGPSTQRTPGLMTGFLTGEEVSKVRLGIRRRLWDPGDEAVSCHYHYVNILSIWSCFVIKPVKKKSVKVSQRWAKILPTVHGAALLPIQSSCVMKKTTEIIARQYLIWPVWGKRSLHWGICQKWFTYLHRNWQFQVCWYD